jgi:hypothetical protein
MLGVFWFVPSIETSVRLSFDPVSQRTTHWHTTDKKTQAISVASPTECDARPTKVVISDSANLSGYTDTLSS